MRLPPGPELTPAKQTARMVMRPLVFMEELRARFGEVATVRLLDQSPWVLVSDPDLVGEVFKAPADILHGGEGKEVLRPVLGDHSVLLLDEDRHMEQRRLLLPPFSGSRIERYEEAMHAVATRGVEAWPLGEATEATRWTRAIALETILRTVFGLEEDERLTPLREALRGLRVPANERESRQPAFQRSITRIDSLIFANIERRRRSGGESDDDVLALLLGAHHEDGRPMSDEEIRDELVSLLVAGYETTAATLAWALELLAHHPDALARAEQEATAGKSDYLDATIREALRMRPPLPVVARAVKQPFELGGYTIPPAASIVPAILLLHHRPDVYPEPESFRPERFLERPPDPNTWIPFGGGVRRCIGARFALREMRVVLTAVLARATVRVAEPEPEPMRCRNVTLVPARGARLILEAR